MLEAELTSRISTDTLINIHGPNGDRSLAAKIVAAEKVNAISQGDAETLHRVRISANGLLHPKKNGAMQKNVLLDLG